MQKIAFYCFWTFICLHTTVSFTEAATDTLDASLAQVDAIIANTESGITLESAPTKESTVSCASNQEFEKNQCNKCFTKEILIGDTILKSSYQISNSENILRIAYKDEQEDPSFINIGNTNWVHSTQNPKYFWINGIDIMWLTNKYDNYNRAQYIIDKNKAPEFYKSDLWVNHLLQSTDRVNNQFVSITKFPFVYHNVDNNTGAEWPIVKEYGCIGYTVKNNIIENIITPKGVTNTPQVIIPSNYTYTAWELIHRTPMLQGFTWTGEIANFITPAMYVGTPLQTNMSDAGYDTSIGATNYSECVRSETDASFGVDGALIEATTEDELRNMAKYCATEFLGSYFTGKDYTTREEMLMFIFTMFDEGIELPGYFDETGFVFDGEETETSYTNVSSQAWFAPYLSLAYNLIMVEDEETWTIAREVTDEDIQTMFDMYLTDEDNIRTDTVETAHGTYSIIIDTDGVSIAKN